MSLIGMFESIAKPEPWVKDALCPQIGDGDLWFPEKGNSARDAKRVCAACPVRAECLNYAVRNRIREGIFGGFSGKERERLLLGRNPMRPPGRPTRKQNGHGFACRCVVCRWRVA